MIERSAFFLNPSNLPFGEAFDIAFEGYFHALRCLIGREQTEWNRPEIEVIVNEPFSSKFNKVSNHFDPHLTDAPFDRDRSGFSPVRTISNGERTGETRPSLLLKRQLAEADRFSDSARSRRGVDAKFSRYLPSPLYFVRQYLTAPDYTASEGYAHAIVRAEIFASALKFNSHLNSGDVSTSHPYRLIREAINFSNVADALQNLHNHQKKRDSIQVRSVTDFIVLHMLASLGMLLLRFDSSGKSGDGERSTVDDFLSEKSLFWEGAHYEFRRAPNVKEFPSAPELINLLDGVPIPIPGAHVVFQGGLRFTKSEGLVSRISGPAGSGKTSFALGLAVALAPLGVKTIYLSAEETPEDLKDRLGTLVPPFVRRTASFEKDTDRWFEAKHLSISEGDDEFQLASLLESWKRELGENLSGQDDCPPGMVPLLIVIDGVHEFFKNGSSKSRDVSAERRLNQLVEHCRKLGALVAIVSAADEESKLTDLDYLVDLVIAIEQRALASSFDSFQRVMHLKKSRRQISRTGYHLFHLSESKGFRIAPNIASQLDEQRCMSWPEPDAKRIFDFALGAEGDRALVGSRDPLIKLYEHSQTLLMGEGSSGKAAMGLKILTSPVFKDGQIRASQKNSDQAKLQFKDTSESPEQASDYSPWLYDSVLKHRRILALSFLYQESYYRGTLQKILKNRKRDIYSIHSTLLPEIVLDVTKFDPGFLGPEDFLNVISRQLDEAELSGFPYHGVLIDGLHNVYLQFPELEKSELVWPLLYELLRLKGVSVVTTHTSFKVGNLQNSVGSDVEVSRRRIGPLLHALVQGADYVLILDPPKALAINEKKLSAAIVSKISKNSSIDDTQTTNWEFYWDREASIVRRSLPSSTKSTES